jgi:3-isopropylmalate/(R)-2-methylmalate dehydratase small subunit
MSTSQIVGRTWVFGDSVDTDVMFPGRALRLPPEEAVPLLFSSLRPSWSEAVEPGDIVVGGEQFGIGSARPVGTLLRLVGVSAVVASSMSSLFQRNCINAGVIAFPVPKVSEICQEGERLQLDIAAGRAANLTTGAETSFAAIPDFVRTIIDNGGVISRLQKEGYLLE